MTLAHDALVERAVRWLRGTRRCGVVFAELTTTAPIIPDAIGWHAGWSVLVECKTSRSDMRADLKKWIHTSPDSCPGQERWYLTPKGLVKPSEVPAEWGLLEVRGSRVFKIKHPPQKPLSLSRTHAELPLLLSALRRHHLGVVWHPERSKFEPMP